MLSDDVAIIGISGAYPDSKNLREFFTNLSNSFDSIRDTSSKRKTDMGLDPDAPCQPIASLDNVDEFDHEFFNISLKEAEFMDPHQRLLLQLACAAIENSGYSLKSFRGSDTAVIISASSGDYGRLFDTSDPAAITGSLSAALAGRIAYALDLRGIALVIDTACSSSLVAIYEACQKLYLGETDCVLAGGINLFFREDRSGSGSIGIIAPDGRSKTFDAAANGAGWGEGGGIVVLKLLKKALADKDQIHAVIKGGAINQDGGRSNGLSAPSPHAQSEVISKAWKNAGVDPLTISYIEAHGTGTELGDPIEIQGITDAFSKFTDAKRFCPIGSIKTNIGHLVGAAGIAGLTKTVLSIKHKKLLPSLHFNTPNPFIDFENSPVFVNTHLADWKLDESSPARRAGLSSFGLSGTNVHLVLEEAPDIPRHTAEAKDKSILFTLSAKSAASLQTYILDLITFLKDTVVPLPDIAYTFNKGRDDYAFRFSAVVDSNQQLIEKLERALTGQGEAVKADAPIVLLFSGDLEAGGEGADCYGPTHRAFKQAAEDCYAIAGRGGLSKSTNLFVQLYARYRQWESQGLSTRQIIGTGVGNLVVSVITGKSELREGLRKAALFEEQQPAFNRDTLKVVVARLLKQERPLFLEMGSGGILSKELDALQSELGKLCVIRAPESATSPINAMAELYKNGATINWDRFYDGEDPYRAECPTYPFQKTRCWIRPPARSASSSQALAQSDQCPAPELYGILPGEATADEQALASIWGEVLKVKELTLDDDFFDLGGSSLNEIQVVGRIETEFNVTVDFIDVYDYSTVRSLCRHIESLKASKPKPVIAGSSLQTSSIQPVERGKHLALSCGQQRLWVIDQHDMGSPVYNIPTDVRLAGCLNIHALEKSLNEIIRRHEILRTTFVAVDGKPYQVIAPAMTLPLPVVDLSALPDGERETRVRELATEHARMPFDLSIGPLLRVSLLRLFGDEHVLLLTMHHIISDGWSSGVLIREITTLYNAYSGMKGAPLPDLNIQYADFAQWEHEWLTGQDLQPDLSYWKEQLAGAPALLELPMDRPRQGVQTFAGARQYLRLPKQLVETIKEIGKREGATLYMTLLAAFQTLLHRYSGQADINIGTPVANRNRVETEDLIGFFVNTLVIRTDMSGDPRFTELLRRIRNVALGAFAHQHLPFDRLVEELQPERNLSHTPLFQVVFVLQNTPMDPVEVSGLVISPYEVDRGTSMFDMTITLGETRDGVTGWWEYNKDLFDDATIKRMLEHFESLLAGVAADPERRIWELPLMQADERNRLLVDWNATRKEYQSDRCFHELFQIQADQTPNAVAVTFRGECFSYSELNGRANQLARYLRGLGEGPEAPIAICVERSPEMLVGLLGILKAGAAYVPLDPSYPKDRLSYTLTDCGAPYVLTQQRLIDHLGNHSERAICLDTEWDEISLQSRDNLPTNTVPENLAYVIYTSGSTGRPKGVMIHHRGLVNYLTWCREAYRLAEGEGSPVHSSIGFDLTITSLFAPLLAGRAVNLLPEDMGIDSLEASLRGRADFSLVKITPAHLEALNQKMLPEEVEGLTRAYVIGGEALKAENLLLWHANAPGTRLINEYGPTETVVGCCVYEVEAGSAISGAIPIGRPIANTQLYILDRNGSPVPIGIAGELHIGGEGVGRGYLNRPELTAEKFVPDPFGGETAARLYKTGDLARYLPDGNIEFLGRMDEQVKIRGFRIELGEIESVLALHPAIREAVVTVREDEPGVRRLVAYLVAGQAAVPPAGELRTWLRDYLPDYMLPSACVVLEALPLTPNGKLDRQALSAPMNAQSEPDKGFVAPRTPFEEALASIWAETLGVERVGIHDNFYELGSDSIINIQVIAKARRAGLHLVPKQLFQYQTIAELAEAAGSGGTVAAQQSAVMGDVPLTPIQNWLLDHSPVDADHWNQSVMLEAKERLDTVAVRKAIQQLLVHHDALRSSFVKEGLVWRQIQTAPDPATPLVEVDLSGLAQASRAAAIEACAEEFQRSLILAEGSLLRAGIFNCGENSPGRLLIVIHHLAVDGVSWRILLEDLQTAYEQAGRGEVIQLQDKTTSFKSWAVGLTQYVLSAGLKNEVDYWMGTEGQDFARISAGNPSGENTQASARTVSVTLSAAETESLLTEVPKAYRTHINEALLSPLVETLAAHAGKQSLLVDVEGHGREQLLAEMDVTRTVGCFTAIFPVLLRVKGEDSGGDPLEHVKQMRRIPNNGIGYGLLRYLCPDPEVRRRLESLPKAEVIFNYLGQFDQLQNESSPFSAASESAGLLRSPRAQRTHLLEINGSIIGGRLRIDWTYSENVHSRGVIESLAQEYKRGLQALIARSARPERHSVFDFPLAGLDQPALDRLIGGDSNVEDIYPLAPMQRGMLFHTAYAPESGIYIEQLGWVLRGELDVPAFGRAWQQVLDSHAALRTAFFWQELDEPLQVVGRQVDLPLELLDWRELHRSEQEQHLEAFLQADRARGFDLSKAPLMRTALIRLAEDAYRFVWTHHHLLLDGWCLPIILDEVFAFYESFRAGKEITLERGHSYRNYLAWLNQQDVSNAYAYWRGVLGGLMAPTPIITSQGAAELERAPGFGEQSRRLPKLTTAAIRTLARQHRLTLNTVFQGAWALLLSRYCGEQDVLFGATVSGRSADVEGIDSTVGLFINTIPVRAQIDQKTNLISWMQALQSRQVESRHHEHTPLYQIQAWSDLPKGVPLFESILVFENYPIRASLKERAKDFSAQLDITDFIVREQTNYPLTVIVEAASELSLRIGYDKQRFDSKTVDRILGHLEALIESFADDPGRRMSEFSILTKKDRQLLLELNQTRQPYPMRKCIHEFVQEKAQSIPESIAVERGRYRLTYRELNEEANRLAHYLRRRGVAAEQRVGICVERGTEMIIGMLGILKAGAAYVPMDPGYPKQRLEYIAEDAHINLLVTQASLLEQMPEHRAGVVCLDRDRQEIAAESKADLDAIIAGENLAYVIYTSGSTGKPKGVAIEHHNTAALIEWSKSIFEEEELEGVLASTSLCFDLSVFEILVTLSRGGRVIVAENALELAEIGEEAGVRLINTVPSAMAELVRMKKIPASVKVVNLAGEALKNGLAQEVYQSSRVEKVWNLYGPSEDTTYSTYALVERGGSRQPSIGKAISNTQAYILDRDLNPVPVGVVGELYLGGEGLSRCYLNRPELTAERYIPDPFSDQPGKRLYGTGDLTRYLEDGNIDYIGRADHQKKIRGFRIELGEIETTLARHPGIRDVVALAREDEPGDMRLVAYIAPHRGAFPAVTELREFLKDSLPDHLIPSAFVFLDEMPLTENGKVNRNTLPRPEQIRPELEQAYVEPRTEIEGKLARIWAEFLRVDRVGLHDNLFELGGDSILSLQVTARANQAGIHLTPRQVFSHQTIAELASVAGTITAVEAEQGTVTGAVPLTPIQRWFFEQKFADRHHWNQSLMLEASAPLDARLLEGSVNRLVLHHDALRLRFSRDSDGWKQANAAPDGSVPFSHLDLSSLSNEAQAGALEEAANLLQASLNLETGPTMRVAMLDLGEPKPARVLFVIHHLAVDGVSWRVLLEDFQTMYEQLRQRRAVSLPAKTTSFRSWSTQLAEHAKSTQLKNELDYWLKTLQKRSRQLPVDYPGGVNTTASARSVSVSLDVEQTRSLLQEVPAAYNTQINEVLLTALAQSMSDWIGDTSILIDLEGHGREELSENSDQSRTVGWFTTMFPVMLRLEDDAPGEALKAIKEQIRQIPNRGIGFGLLRFGNDPDVSESLHGLQQPDVSFNYLGQFDQMIYGSTLFSLAAESTGNARSLRDRRPHLLEVNGSVAGGQLWMIWTYSENIHDRATIERVAENFMKALRQLIDCCLSPNMGGYTPSDFPMANLPQSKLSKLLDSVEFEE